MLFDVYCDENHPDLFSSKNPQARFLTIGSLWLPSSIRQEIKDKIWHLRHEHKIWGEIKWQKVSKNSLSFYKEVIDLFISYGEQLRFRCIAIDHSTFNQNYCQNDNELGFYKFYYQVLHHWILDFNHYHIFCDIKTNKEQSRLHVLKNCLNNANIFSTINTVQALPSKEVVLIQISDLLLGITSARLNNKLNSGSVKEQLVIHLEQRLNKVLSPTSRNENKFNIFKINLSGGW